MLVDDDDDDDGHGGHDDTVDNYNYKDGDDEMFKCVLRCESWINAIATLTWLNIIIAYHLIILLVEYYHNNIIFHKYCFPNLH